MKGPGNGIKGAAGCTGGTGGIGGIGGVGGIGGIGGIVIYKKVNASGGAGLSGWIPVYIDPIPEKSGCPWKFPRQGIIPGPPISLNNNS